MGCIGLGFRRHGEETGNYYDGLDRRVYRGYLGGLG